MAILMVPASALEYGEMRSLVDLGQWNAERRTLLAWMIDRDAMPSPLDGRLLITEWSPRNRKIAEVFVSLLEAGEPTDFVTVSDELQRRGVYDEVGGLDYLGGLLAGVL